MLIIKDRQAYLHQAYVNKQIWMVTCLNSSTNGAFWKQTNRKHNSDPEPDHNYIMSSKGLTRNNLWGYF